MSSPILLGVAAPYAPAIHPTEVSRRALWRFWCIGMTIYLLAMAGLMGLEGDFVIADRLYAWQGHTWQFRQQWLTTSFIHEGGKRLSWLMWLGTLLFTLMVWRRPAWRTWRRPLLVLLGSVLLSTGVVAGIKHAVPMACPWDLQRYGGGRAYIGLFDVWPTGWPRYRCFPAAHASSGFAWIALYFFCLQQAPPWRRWGLGAGLLLGGIFSISQELRGAHFLLHDLTTVMICWTVALALHTGARIGDRA